MKTRVVNTVLISVLLLGALVCLRWPRTVPLKECSEVYRHYVDCDGIDAAYIQDYPINDTLTVAVTLLEAMTDSGWVTLQKDFGLPVVPKEYEELICGDSNKVSLKLFPKNEPLCSEGDTLVYDVLAISFYKHAIVHLEVKNRLQSNLFICKQFDENEKNDIQRYSNYE